MQTTGQKLKRMEQRLLNALSMTGIDYVRNGNSHGIPGNINLSFHHSNGEMLSHRLDLMGICVSTGSACDSVNAQISHVIKTIGVPNEYAEGMIRISFGVENNEYDADTVANALICLLSSEK